MELKLTKEELIKSKEYKNWISGRVDLIRNIYDSDEIYPAYIVITSDMGKFTITRFWVDFKKKIYVSVDYTDISTIEVFEKLLSEYSRPLE